MKNKDYLFKLWVYGSGILTLLITFGIFLYTLFKGYPVISLSFIFDVPRGVPLGTEGGIFPAIIGSLLLGLLSGCIGGIISLCNAIYLVFYCTNARKQALLIGALEILAGVPSIVLGLFGYSMLLIQLGMKRSLLTASITLAIMIIPFITLRIKKALEEISQDQFMTSLSLGLSKSYTIIHLVLPHVIGRICTSLGLGIGFAMGATAPIMFTGAVIFTDVPNHLTDPFMALPYHLYMLANQGISLEMAYGTAFVLIVILLIINFMCQLVYYLKGKKQ